MDKFPPDQITAVLTAMISWAVRLLISGKQGSGALESVYGSAAKEVTDGKLKNAAAVAARIKPAIPTDEQFQLDFTAAKVSKEPVARYYLRAMESQNRKEAEAYLVPNDGTSLEHIMPEKHGKDWQHVTAQDHEDFLKRIGNLALLPAGTNSKLGGKSLDEERERYKAAALTLTSMVAEYKQWTHVEIEGRQKNLAEIAVKTWPI